MALHPVVGHEAVRRMLARAHRNGGLPDALLLYGPRGVGKQRLALWAAQLQVCEAPEAGEPCGTCRPCRLSLALGHPDIHWYFPLPRPRGVSGDRLAPALEAARSEALEELRTQPLRASDDDELRGLYLDLVRGLRRQAQMRPAEGGVQVFIIADAEFLVPQEASPEAANALLKVLEEPPVGTKLILTSSQAGRLLPTIRSRAVPVHVPPLPVDEVAAFLTSRGYGTDVAAWAAGMGMGSIGRSLGFLPDDDDPGPLELRRRQAREILDAALAPGRGAAHARAVSFAPAGARSLVAMFAFVEEWLRDLAAVSAGAEGRVLNRDALEHLRRLASETRVRAPDISGAFPALEEARELARGNVNPQLIVFHLLRRLRRSLGVARTENVAGRS